ncbi:hypothetical protein HA402_005849 [Bradysia odoriphaga]|uniref:Odorant-binding protein 43 n=1 Tax=Bradysia odoriphaga TaxID=1564500 RepID=A0A2S0X9K2_9DIPT|nr:odorant-binding protein 43 [Bradysia odoriphaga]KAG4076406.1 hypothetical protein HA402_005849 [Bradysia odoriphaga]
MKHCLVVLCWIAAVLADEWTVKHSSDLKLARSKCATTLNVPDDAFSNYQQRIFSDSDPLAKAYIGCVFKELGVFGDNGFYVDRVVSQFVTEPADAARLEKCSEKIDTDTSDDIWAFRAFRCFTKVNEPEFYMQLDMTD